MWNKRLAVAWELGEGDMLIVIEDPVGSMVVVVGAESFVAYKRGLAVAEKPVEEKVMVVIQKPLEESMPNEDENFVD